ncbi:CDP-alcohol phosphatidyltransferase family protein [Micromonospora sp. BRA006-A]|nr:CDP-alcohol phosphatidyltransferase family protein [Micromonospora sp. BRA006-A]
MVTVAALGYGLRRSGADRLGPADWVTLTRATLAGGVAALTVDSFREPIVVPVLVVLSAVALSLDWVDGQVARRTGTVSALGARFDMEVDSFLVLVLCGYVADQVGAWVLVIGAMRYVFVAAGWVLPWMRGSLPPRYGWQGGRRHAGHRPGGGGGGRPAPAARRRGFSARSRCSSSRSAVTSPGCGGTAYRRGDAGGAPGRAGVPRARRSPLRVDAGRADRAPARRGRRATPVTDLSRRADGDDAPNGTATDDNDAGTTTDDAAVPGRPRARRLLAATVTALAAALVLVALVAPSDVNEFSPGAFLRIPRWKG